MHTFDVIWKIGIFVLLLGISGSLGVMAQAFKMQSEAFAASVQQEG